MIYYLTGKKSKNFVIMNYESPSDKIDPIDILTSEVLRVQ